MKNEIKSNLKSVKPHKLTATDLPSVRIADASFPAPFRSGLEYSSPARGTWNIVHTGMLVPECHEIYVCAAGCLRGVVLTAAEMGLMDRFSTVAIRENNLLEGDMETLVIEGVTDIITSCRRGRRRSWSTRAACITSPARTWISFTASFGSASRTSISRTRT